MQLASYHKPAVILVGTLEDEPDLRSQLVESTNALIWEEFSERYDVMEADTEQEVRNLITTRVVPLIVVGYDNNRADPLSLASALKTCLPNATVVLLTPFTSVELEDAARSQGLDRCLARPFNIERYEQIVRAALDADVNKALAIPITTAPTTTDRVVAVSKASFGAMPLVGSMLAEAIGSLIPNQRIDRIERFMRILAVKIQILREEQVRERFRSPEFIDLFEDSMFQATRALSGERLSYIASLVKNSLSSEAMEHLHYKHLLSLLEEINDVEVIILKSYTFRHQGDPKRAAFFEQHRHVLIVARVTTGGSQQLKDKYIFHAAYLDHLFRLGLLQKDFVIKEGETPKIDPTTGTALSNGYRLSGLGQRLLRQIDLAD